MFVSPFTMLRITETRAGATDLEQDCFKKGEKLTLTTLNKHFILTWYLLFYLFSVVIRGRGARRVSRGDSSAWRRSTVKRQQVNTLTDPCGRARVHVWSLHASASTQAGMFFPPTAPDVAVCSTDAEKEEDEPATQAQTAADESSVKVPPVLINLCR